MIIIMDTYGYLWYVTACDHLAKSTDRDDHLIPRCSHDAFSGALVIGRTSLARSHVAAGAHSESHGMCHLEALAPQTAGSWWFPKIGWNIL